MNKMNNPLTDVNVEFHILQSFPATCLKRDDIGEPKKVEAGGTTRARVSSQCWERVARKAFDPVLDGLDIALFGRMATNTADLDVKPACSFSDAISTHEIGNVLDSATYYRYVCLDLGQLWETLGGKGVSKAIESFTKALYIAVPTARQATQFGASPWDFAKVMVRKGQCLQVPFEILQLSQKRGISQSSIDALTEYLDRQEKFTGSLFGKIDSYIYGEDENFSIDDLVSVLCAHADVICSHTSFSDYAVGI